MIPGVITKIIILHSINIDWWLNKLNLDIEYGENPGKISVAKMCSNEFWAKFSQKPNKIKIDLNRWYNILMDDKLKILNRVVFFSDIFTSNARLTILCLE